MNVDCDRSHRCMIGVCYAIAIITTMVISVIGRKLVYSCDVAVGIRSCRYIICDPRTRVVSFHFVSFSVVYVAERQSSITGTQIENYILS